MSIHKLLPPSHHNSVIPQQRSAEQATMWLWDISVSVAKLMNILTMH